MVGGTGEEESDFLKAFKAVFVEGNRVWNEGDVKRAYAGLPEDFEYQLAAAWPNARPLRGPDEVVAFFEDFQETFPDVQATPIYEFIEVDEGTMIVGFRVAGTGRRSGARTELDVWQVWEVGERMVPVRVIEFPDRGAALEAAGKQAVERER